MSLEYKFYVFTSLKTVQHSYVANVTLWYSKTFFCRMRRNSYNSSSYINEMSFVNGIKRSIKGVCIKIFGVWFANYTKFKITSLIIQVFGFKPLFKVLFIFIFIPIRIKLYLTRGWYWYGGNAARRARVSKQLKIYLIKTTYPLQHYFHKVLYNWAKALHHVYPHHQKLNTITYGGK